MLLISLLLTIGFAQEVQESLSEQLHVETVNSVQANENGDPVTYRYDQVIDRISKHFSDKFYCFKDGVEDDNGNTVGMYDDWSRQVYPQDVQGNNKQTGRILKRWFCCGYMANGRKQCDKIGAWKLVNGNTFTLCETDYASAYSETDSNGNPKPRRDLCCQNDEFQDCTSCKSFVVWDFTVDEDSFGGDKVLEASYNCNAASDEDYPPDCENDVSSKVTLKNTWRDTFYGQPAKTIEGTDVQFPPYAYGNKIYPAGFAQGTLREFNDPPICVYAPNVAGRVLEIRVEPEEAGSQLCVDDLLADTSEKNNPGVTQACDDVRLQSCFPDANSDETDGAQGFAFLISCSESCADGDVDLWFRLRSSVNKWTDAGLEEFGTDKTEVNTEMWCMWGNQNMFGELPDTNSFAGIDGDFSRWDVYPSDLEPEVDPQVRPVESSVSYLSLAVLVSALALLF